MYQQDVPPVPRTAEQQAIHDARAVHDTAGLRFRDYFGPGGQADWVLARVDAAPQSGHATIPGGTIRGGQLTAPAGAVAVLMKIGTWSRLAGEGGANGAPYSWTEPLEEEKRNLSAEDYYSPFVAGGVLLFRPAPAPGLGAFAAPRLLFDDWAADVAPALKLGREYADALGKMEPDPATDARLVNLTGHRNRLIAVAAFRQWALRPQADRALAADRLARSKGHMKAVLLYSLLVAANDDAVAKEVREAVSIAVDSESLRSLALGAFAASLFMRANAPAAALGDEVMNTVKTRLGAGAVAADPYLRALYPR